MSPVDARTVALVAEIRRDWAAVRHHAARASTTDPARGDAEAALVALSLDHAYQALETILVRVEQTLGLPERAGASWHAQVLADASLPLPKLRPAIIPHDALGDWDRVMKFRHFLRHAYVVDLDAARLVETTEHLSRAVAATDEAISVLVKALEAE